ncbi:hypothetical protein N0V84_009555 [Fusarium piperis]|uniref:Uncharacterized protein n=1 Tax=Fusarium piperis TaxID=1435070 RepID=A0A9W9BKB9_9HYPO|nr:hypothetical protein N0V84_009555 [Fusarium piperis]
MLIPHGIIALVVAGAAMAGGLFGWLRNPKLDLTQAESLLSPAGLICHSHEKLAQLQLLALDKPTTLFSVLRLDSPKPPFDPPHNCAYPYSPNYKATKRAITNAWTEMSDNHDGNMREWRDAFSMAAFTLLNDTSRTIYMKDVLPKLNNAKGRGGSDTVIRDFCKKK